MRTEVVQVSKVESHPRPEPELSLKQKQQIETYFLNMNITENKQNLSDQNLNNQQ
jgi:hypothetical protein